MNETTNKSTNKQMERAGLKPRYSVPCRRERGTHYGNSFLEFLSYKCSFTYSCFSELEWCNMVALEMNPEVLHYTPQPFNDEIVDETGDRRAVMPDVYVLYRNGAEEIQEVKYAADLKHTDTETEQRREQVDGNLRQVRFEKLWADRNRMNFRVVTDEDVMGEPYTVNNASYLFARLKRSASRPMANEIEAMKFAMSDGRKHTVESLSKVTGLSLAQIWDCVAKMVANGAVCMPDCRKPLDKRTEVRLS